jgi:hypothetical protein
MIRLNLAFSTILWCICCQFQWPVSCMKQERPSVFWLASQDWRRLFGHYVTASQIRTSWTTAKKKAASWYFRSGRAWHPEPLLLKVAAHKLPGRWLVVVVVVVLLAVVWSRRQSRKHPGRLSGNAYCLLVTYNSWWILEQGTSTNLCSTTDGRIMYRTVYSSIGGLRGGKHSLVGATGA